MLLLAPQLQFSSAYAYSGPTLNAILLDTRHELWPVQVAMCVMGAVAAAAALDLARQITREVLPNEEVV